MLKTKLAIISFILMIICTGCGAEKNYSLPVYGDPPTTDANAYEM